METLGLYVQIPFCASKCTYCNFSSRVGGEAELSAYSEALRGEIAGLDVMYARMGFGAGLLGLPVDTIYLGGGTPTLLGLERLRILLGELGRAWRVLPQAECTLEAAPGFADEKMLESLRALGVNRLSIGAQSFNDRELRAVGRLHSAGGTRKMVEAARRAGFGNISLDLIAGLPYQTVESWRNSLEAALELAPEHISVYLFEVDEKSRLGAEVLRQGSRYSAAAVPDEDFMAAAYERARKTLAAAGYAQYEISNFARPGWESRHNRKYWRLKPYVGLGAGAHSFDGEHRWSNVTDPAAYGARLAAGESPVAESRALDGREQIEEFFFLGLREREGVSLRGAEERWGARRLAPWQPVISALNREGWLERRGEWIRLPEAAFLVSNEVFARFLA